MIIGTETIIVIAGGGLMSGGLTVIGFMVKSVLKKLDGMVPETLCWERRQGHDKVHEAAKQNEDEKIDRLKQDIDGVGKIARSHHG